MALHIEVTEESERELLFEDELEPEVLYLSTRDTGYVYFVLDGFEGGHRHVAYAGDSGTGFIDHRDTTQEFYLAPEGTVFGIYNGE